MTQKHADKIASVLEHRILTGQTSGGARLDETALSKEFNVSRTPIREALHILVASGLVERKPNRGVFVQEVGPAKLMDMFETMGELEASCARLAAKRMSVAALDELALANDRCLNAAKAHDQDRYYLENEVFHQMIYEGSGNAELAEMTHQMQRRLRPYRKIQLTFRDRLDQSRNEHDEILQALRAGIPGRAADIMRRHVVIQGEKFRQLIATLTSSKQDR